MTLSQRRFTLDSIDVWTTWQGSVDYASLIGLSLMMMNRQQLNLAQINSQSLEPIRVDLRGVDRTSTLPRKMISSKPCGRGRWFPRAISGVVERFRWLALGKAGSAHVGVFQPRQLQLPSSDCDRLRLQLQGETATIRLIAPVQVVVETQLDEANQLL